MKVGCQVIRLDSLFIIKLGGIDVLDIFPELLIVAHDGSLIYWKLRLNDQANFLWSHVVMWSKKSEKRALTAKKGCDYKLIFEL